jgi:hypothetical protein
MGCIAADRMLQRLLVLGLVKREMEEWLVGSRKEGKEVQ